MTSEAFWDRHAPKYAKKPIADVAAYEDKLRDIRAILHPDDHVLEIGCGTGGTARFIASVVAQVTATDISSQMIRIAKSRSEGLTTRQPKFIQVEAGQAVPGGPFDTVCAFSLLHLVDDIPDVLNSVFRQVKPGGYFISKTACLKDCPRWMQVMVRMMVAVRIGPQVSFISRAELTQLLIQTGFEIEQSKYFGKNRMSPFIVARKPTT